MILEISRGEILSGLMRQLQSFFPVSDSENRFLDSLCDPVLKRCEYCFSKAENKYYSKEGQPYFNPYHSGQYTLFLYYFSNSIFKKDKKYITLADKVYYLNRIMNSCDLFYEVDLPDIFMLDHPVGSVMGRAKYGDYFSFGQNCTVGNNKGVFPIIGHHVRMTANSTILGNSYIGNNIIVGAGACIKDENIPDDSIVFGDSPNLIIKSRINR